eukprot:COSAG01_NODE_8271_length_2848_cov_2.619498_3_plen_97_part_00
MHTAKADYYRLYVIRPHYAAFGADRRDLPLRYMPNSSSDVHTTLRAEISTLASSSGIIRHTFHQVPSRAIAALNSGTLTVNIHTGYISSRMTTHVT